MKKYPTGLVIAQDYQMELVRSFLFVGHNENINIATVPQDIWPLGGLYQFPTSAVAVEVLSSSANDTAAGTGLRTVSVSGLDADYNPIAQIVTLNGTTPVALTQQYFRINGFIGLTVGSAASNVGDITIRTAFSQTILSRIPVGQGRAQQAIWTVPAGRTFFAKHVSAGIKRIKAGDFVSIVIHTRAAGGPWTRRITLPPANTGTNFVIFETNIQ